MSPYEGCYELVKKYFNGVVPESFTILLNNCKDFDSVAKRVTEGSYTPGQQYDGTSNILLNLEDIHASWVESYLGNIIYNINGGQNDVSYKVYEAKELEKPMFHDQETGEMIDPSELDGLDEDYSRAETIMWQEKLPYLIKRLHEESKRRGYSLMSLIIAYERAKKKKQCTPKPGDILLEECFKMTPQGLIGSRVVKNTHKDAEALLWIRGMSPDIAYDEAMEFLYICDRLKISVADEDARTYQEPFIKKLVVTYLATSKEVGKRINPRVLEGLRGLTLSSYGEVTSKVAKEKTTQEIAHEKVLLFCASTDEEIAKYRDSELLEAECQTWTGALYNYYKSQGRNLVNPLDKKCRTVKGFFVDKYGDYVVFKVDALMDSSKYQFLDKFAILHCSGFFVLLDESSDITYLDINLAGEYIRALFKASNKKELEQLRFTNKNHKFGRWEETYR